MNDHHVIQLRLAGPQDVAMLADLGAKTFFESFAVYNTPEDMESYLRMSFSEQKQAEELSTPDSIFIIAESEGKPVGYARLLGGSTETCITGARPIELVRIYVLQEWKGRKVGSLLMQKCLEEARGGGYDTIWLGVWENNPGAIAFYQKWGFIKAGTHTFMLGQDVQEDWIMQRSLG